MALTLPDSDSYLHSLMITVLDFNLQPYFYIMSLLAVSFNASYTLYPKPKQPVAFIPNFRIPTPDEHNQFASLPDFQTPKLKTTTIILHLYPNLTANDAEITLQHERERRERAA
jgi:hypothetical protein